MMIRDDDLGLTTQDSGLTAVSISASSAGTASSIPAGCGAPLIVSLVDAIWGEVKNLGSS